MMCGRNPSLMKAGFHSKALQGIPGDPLGRNPSLMRAGFHQKEKEKKVKRVFSESQSLVNEGRFPQKSFLESKEKEKKSLSQSLVNEGRFPQIW